LEKRLNRVFQIGGYLPGFRSAERALVRLDPSIPRESLRFCLSFGVAGPVPLNGLFTTLPMKAVRLVERDEPLRRTVARGSVKRPRAGECGVNRCVHLHSISYNIFVDLTV
jgi:hypothetical protein